MIGLVLMTFLAACAGQKGTESSPAAVAAAAYAAPGPKTLTLITVVNNRTGSGGHTGLIVNGSQQVIFDPAGSFRDPRVVERGDVLYGMTPAWVQSYKSAHARSTYHIVSQEIQVTPAQAERALQLVQASGPVPSAYCANATSAILAQVPGFAGVSNTFYPVKLMDQFGALPGVKTTKYYEDDEGDVIDAVRAGQILAAQ
jgi:hypothetical protein